MEQNSIRLKKAEAKHATDLKEIYRQCRKELGSFNLYQCWEHYLSGKNKETFTVAEYVHNRRSEVVGFIRWSFSKKYGVNVVKDVGVLTQARGSGTGLRLLRSVPVPLMLKCNADNEVGNKFYEKVGLVCAGKTQTRKGNPQIIWTCAE